MEKSDIDKITDDLFAEMQFAIRSEEMGSSPRTVTFYLHIFRLLVEIFYNAANRRIVNFNIPQAIL